jgi:Tol biopolymer transport system component
MKTLLTVGLIVAVCSAHAQTGSEILLFDLKARKGNVEISNPKNITNHIGYDNQPSFHQDLPYIYFSSFDTAGRSDIKRYDFKTGTLANITVTREREYSPTLTPDKNSLSCIIQRDNNAQDLGKYPVDGGEPSVIIDNMTIGYHVWADNSHLGLFVLGANGAPHSLHYMRLPTKEDTVIATDIGRSLHRIPNKRAISFIQRGKDVSTIMKLDTETMKTSSITSTIANGDHITWLPDGRILTTDGAKLFFFDPRKSSRGWTEVTVGSGGESLKGISRLAVSPKGDKLAVVVAE